MSLPPRNAVPGGAPQPHLDEDEEDEEEPDIGMGSFMSGDPNFNRETSDSQSMTKALSTLKTYLSQYSEMKRFRPAMLVFLHSLLARKEAKWYKALNFVFFDWLADDWKTAGLASKQSKRAAFSVYSTFLNREGSLSLEAVARSLDPGLGLGRPALNEPIKTLSQLFAKRPMDSHIERIAAGFSSAQASLRPTLEALVASVSAEIQTKRRDGFVSDILPGVDGLRPDLSDERQQRFIEQCRGVMLAHVNYMIGTPFGGHLEAGCLASLLERFFRLRLPPELPPELPQFNFQRLRGSGGRSFGGLKEIERRGTHLLRPVELDRIRACSACGKLLCGPGPQAMRCKVGDCQVVSHRACMDLVKPISCSSAAGLLTRSHSNEGRDSSAPKAAARSSAADAAATEPESQASTAAAAGPPLPHPVASMPQLGADFGGDGGRSGHRGSLDSGQDAMVGDSMLLSPCDMVVEPALRQLTFPFEVRVARERNPNIFDPNQLRLETGDIVEVQQPDEQQPEIWFGFNQRSKRQGYFPFNYVCPLSASSKRLTSHSFSSMSTMVTQTANSSGDLIDKFVSQH
ncbi:hypothetical protein BOX15_Mlig025910g2 [Macrostomum lignano]|uniref:SH3 domain-containing protein n=1 Tax=Macrostomum lignano TaxID=282301 RepID=A0A267G8T5_9PLAT|nr:hypothetical protein BOX15_Mlig025910g2 [Macrostomum lignano]